MISLNYTSNFNRPILQINNPLPFNEAFYLFVAPFYLISSIFSIILVIISVLTIKLIKKNILIFKIIYYIRIYTQFIYQLKYYERKQIKISKNNNLYASISFIFFLNTVISILILVLFCFQWIQNNNNLNLDINSVTQPNSLLK